MEHSLRASRQAHCRIETTLCSYFRRETIRLTAHVMLAETIPLAGRGGLRAPDSGLSRGKDMDILLVRLMRPLNDFILTSSASKTKRLEDAMQCNATVNSTRLRCAANSHIVLPLYHITSPATERKLHTRSA